MIYLRPILLSLLLIQITSLQVRAAESAGKAQNSFQVRVQLHSQGACAQAAKKVVSACSMWNTKALLPAAGVGAAVGLGGKQALGIHEAASALAGVGAACGTVGLIAQRKCAKLTETCFAACSHPPTTDDQAAYALDLENICKSIGIRKSKLLKRQSIACGVAAAGAAAIGYATRDRKASHNDEEEQKVKTIKEQSHSIKRGSDKDKDKGEVEGSARADKDQIPARAMEKKGPTLASVVPIPEAVAKCEKRLHLNTCYDHVNTYCLENPVDNICKSFCKQKRHADACQAEILLSGEAGSAGNEKEDCEAGFEFSSYHHTCLLEGAPEVPMYIYAEKNYGWSDEFAKKVALAIVKKLEYRVAVQVGSLDIGGRPTNYKNAGGIIVVSEPPWECKVNGKIQRCAGETLNSSIRSPALRTQRGGPDRTADVIIHELGHIYLDCGNECHGFQMSLNNPEYIQALVSGINITSRASKQMRGISSSSSTGRDESAPRPHNTGK